MADGGSADPSAPTEEVARADHPADARQPGESRHSHFPCFDGLRAIAATAVLVHHAGFATGYSVNGRFGALFAHGDAGVSVFFLISGFLLYRPFVASHLSGREPMRADRFLWRRFLRIVPGYWLALIGIYLIFGFQKGTLHSPGDFISYFGLAQIYDTKRFFLGVNQAWSLGTELSFYLFLPLYAWGIRRIAARFSTHKLRVEVIGLITLAVTCVVWRLAWWSYDPFWNHVGGGIQRGKEAPFSALATLYWLPTHFDLFATGMALALISVWITQRGVVPKLIERIGRAPELCWVAAAFTYWVVCTRVGLPRRLVVLDGGQYFVRQTLYGLTGLLLLLPAVFGDQERGLVRGFLRLKPVAYVGLVSYGVYLWHQAWIGQVRTGWLHQTTEFGGPLVTILVIAFAYTLITATLSYFLVERPILRFKDNPPWRPRPIRAKELATS